MSGRTVSSALESLINEYDQQRNNLSLGHSEANIEKAVLNAIKPVKVKNELPVIEVNGIKGYWINKDEVENWRGKLPIDQYQINFDKNPKIIKKKLTTRIDQNQLIGVNYLRPPTPPRPGDIIIREEPPRQAPPLSPIIKREIVYVYNETPKKVEKTKSKKTTSRAIQPYLTQSAGNGPRQTITRSNYIQPQQRTVTQATYYQQPTKIQQYQQTYYQPQNTYYQYPQTYPQNYRYYY